MRRPDCLTSGFVCSLRLKYRRQASSGLSSIVYLLTKENLQTRCLSWSRPVIHQSLVVFRLRIVCLRVSLVLLRLSLSLISSLSLLPYSLSRHHFLLHLTSRFIAGFQPSVFNTNLCLQS